MTTMALAVDHGAQHSRNGWCWEPHVNSRQTFSISRQMRSEGVLRACSRSVVWVRGAAAAATVASQANPSPNEMTSQQHQRDNNEGQLGDSPPRPVRQQPVVGVEPNNGPKGCAMQQLVGYQRKPVGSV